MIGKFLCLALLGSTLVQSDPLWRRDERSSLDEANKEKIPFHKINKRGLPSNGNQSRLSYSEQLPQPPQLAQRPDLEQTASGSQRPSPAHQPPPRDVEAPPPYIDEKTYRRQNSQSSSHGSSNVYPKEQTASGSQGPSPAHQPPPRDVEAPPPYIDEQTYRRQNSQSSSHGASNVYPKEQTASGSQGPSPAHQPPPRDVEAPPPYIDEQTYRRQNSQSSSHGASNVYPEEQIASGSRRSSSTRQPPPQDVEAPPPYIDEKTYRRQNSQSSSHGASNVYPEEQTASGSRRSSTRQPPPQDVEAQPPYTNERTNRRRNSQSALQHAPNIYPKEQTASGSRRRSSTGQALPQDFNVQPPRTDERTNRRRNSQSASQNAPDSTPLQPFGADPRRMQCPRCLTTIVTRVEKKITKNTHLIATELCTKGLLLCAPLPYCMDSCLTKKHHCPWCDAFLGQYEPYGL